MKKVVGVMIFVLCFCQIMVVQGHPGRTDANGCHYCRTNCANWGLQNGEYHCHNGGSSTNSRVNNNNDNNSNNNTEMVAPTVTEIWGCTNKKATNYNAQATKDDGSCILPVEGCMNPEAINYNVKANQADGSCRFKETVTEEKKISYKTTYQDDDTLEQGTEKTKIKGKDGVNKITYEVIRDEQRKTIEKNKIKTEVLTPVQNEVILKGTKIETSPMGTFLGVLWIIGIIFNLIYVKKDIESKTLFMKIKKQPKYFAWIFYILYYICVIPVYIDSVILLLQLFKAKRKAS